MSRGEGGLDLAALRRAEARLDASEAGRGRVHVEQLRAVLELYPPWRYDDPEGLELRADDVEPDDVDLTRQRILTTDTRWTLDLNSPYTWL